MTKFANLSSWLAAVACGLCLALAVLATPTTALATDPGPGSDDPGLIGTACSNCSPSGNSCSHRVWPFCVCLAPGQYCKPIAGCECYPPI